MKRQHFLGVAASLILLSSSVQVGAFGVIPCARTMGAFGVTAREAKLDFILDYPGWQPVDYRFVYWEDGTPVDERTMTHWKTFAIQVPVVSPRRTYAHISGLKPQTLYHFLIEVQNSAGVFTSPPSSFVTKRNLTVEPMDSVLATGDEGIILAMDGMPVEDFCVAVVVADREKYVCCPARNAENFFLNPYASLDDANEIVMLFPQPVTTIYIIERGADDTAMVQAIDKDGNLMGARTLIFYTDWMRPGYKIGGVDVGALRVLSDIPIYGLRMTPTPGQYMGLDPASISGR
ncbi:fibronectin type III domain-containing protein [Planctomycetota bacterium]